MFSYNRRVKIILSPAKKMKTANDFPLPLSTPRFAKEAAFLMDTMADAGPAFMQKAWALSDKMMQKAWPALLQARAHPENISAALLTYDGIAFSAMAPGVFTDDEWKWAQEHLRILSALYGVLTPLDGIHFYRLEMAQRLPFSLYDYWKDRLAAAMEDDCIINLASKEYADALRPFSKLIDVRFFEEENGKRREKGVYVKMARGAMVRYLARKNAGSPEDLRGFDQLGYRYDPGASDSSLYVFVRNKENQPTS